MLNIFETKLKNKIIKLKKEQITKMFKINYYCGYIYKINFSNFIEMSNRFAQRYVIKSLWKIKQYKKKYGNDDSRNWILITTTITLQNILKRKKK